MPDDPRIPPPSPPRDPREPPPRDPPPQRDRYRPPRQERSRSTVDAIFEAAARVVDEAGAEAATTGRIAHVAGVSIGSLYQYFPRKDALFAAPTERAMEADLARVRAAVDLARDQPLEVGARAVLRAGFAFILARPRLFCWMVRYLPELVLLPSIERWERALVAEIRRFLADHPTELAGLDLDLQALICVGAARGSLLLVARERPEVLHQTSVALDLALDTWLGMLEAQRARLRNPSAAP